MKAKICGNDKEGHLVNIKGYNYADGTTSEIPHPAIRIKFTDSNGIEGNMYIQMTSDPSRACFYRKDTGAEIRAGFTHDCYAYTKIRTKEELFEYTEAHPKEHDFTKIGDIKYIHSEKHPQYLNGNVPIFYGAEKPFCTSVSIKNEKEYKVKVLDRFLKVLSQEKCDFYEAERTIGKKNIENNIEANFIDLNEKDKFDLAFSIRCETYKLKHELRFEQGLEATRYVEKMPDKLLYFEKWKESHKDDEFFKAESKTLEATIKYEYYAEKKEKFEKIEKTADYKISVSEAKIIQAERDTILSPDAKAQLINELKQEKEVLLAEKYNAHYKVDICVKKMTDALADIKDLEDKDIDNIDDIDKTESDDDDVNSNDYDDLDDYGE